MFIMTIMVYSCSKDEENPNIPVTTLTLAADSVAIMPGEELNLTYTYAPKNTTDIVSVIWKIENTDIANFDIYSTTTIYGKTPGQTYVVGYFRDRPEITDTCIINVIPRAVNRIEMDKTSLEMFVGDDSLLRATVYPENATYQTLKWNSSDENIAIVENGKVSALSAGTADIFAETLDGAIKAKCTVQVKNILVSNITINELAPKQKFLIGEELQLTYDVYPENAFNKKIKISSSDESVIKIDKDLKLQALSKGEAVITVTSEDGGTTNNYEVTVGDITLFISTGISGSYTNIMGYITGTIYCTLYNRSNHSINVTSAVTLNGAGTTIATATGDLLGQVLPLSSSKDIGGQFKSVYYPKFVWTYEYAGKTYQLTYDTQKED